MGFLRIVIVFLLLFPAAAFSAELGAARLSLLRGDVQIYTEDTGEWVAASINMPLREGDRLWVPEESRAEIHIQGGIYIRLGSATAFDILALQEESFQFYLNGGHAYINNRKGGIDHIQVDTPQSSVGCYDNSLVMIDVAESGATDVSVLKGYAFAETRNGKARVESSSTLHIGSDMTAELSPLAPPDQWETWNRERDKQLAAGNRSLRYIPDELDDYAYELDTYGKWVYVTDYGYCWTPLSVSAGWSPYRLGRWVWVGGEFVWVSFEPWGWVPHHYGRWAFVANFGWCWVPPPAGGVYWAPGYVGWVHNPSYVAWVPLAPGDIYYGRGYYGPRSVNITNITIINRTVVRDFRNADVRNAVTVVNRDSFISGRRERVRVRVNPFREANVEIGPPAVKPARAAAMPVIRSIPPARRPPERVQRITVDEIRRERKVVREERGSVFRQERPGAEMPVRRRSEPPQQLIRGEHPALPAAKPQRREPVAPQGELRQPAKAPEITRGRPAPPPAKPAAVPQPPPAVTPAQPGTPGQPPSRTGGEPPEKVQRRERGVPREPRWQEPIPPGRGGAQRREVSPQPPPQGAMPAVETPAQPRSQQPLPRLKARPQPLPRQAPPQGEQKELAPAPRAPEEKGERPPEKEPRRLKRE